ncbi:O-antigen polymerase [Candidatus Symbiobacter mobilis CR]|uniref:O-antigen polymerase n=2 Tax=Candidatus Symbiobacter TaxID=1436289 RepID=U5NB18_9BURK|nr:O-antigen polymerase [Candidatus Symbiobacter mobilis CR]
MAALAPAVGVPYEELLQDTLKSIVVAAGTLAACGGFLWAYRNGPQDAWLPHALPHDALPPLALPPLAVLPFGLMAYALGSMAWSHTYLAGVEAVRWFLFGSIVLLGTQLFSVRHVTLLAWGVHLGAVVASLWASWQFWFGWSFFPQGPNPASTFINRNFLAEYLVCALPYSVLLLARVRDKSTVFVLSASLAWVVVALLMTGTRSALTALAGLAVVLPTALWMLRREVVSQGWSRGHVVALVATLGLVIAGLGSIPTNNTTLIQEYGRIDALHRSTQRVASLTQPQEYTEGSISIRSRMWMATLRMIADHPLAGVGAGAWEVHVPRYQDDDLSTELDYYAHHEPLQLVAEYGLVGWGFLVLLLAYLARTAFQIWRERNAGVAIPADTPAEMHATMHDATQAELPTTMQADALIRTCALASVAALLWVSQGGFPWRMAATGALFALGLAVLSAADRASNAVIPPWFRPRPWTIQRHHAVAMLCAMAVCIGMAIAISTQAVRCEWWLVRAGKTALGIAATRTAQDPRWDAEKQAVVGWLREGIAIHPHYRKLSVIAADAMARWGDWAHATWVWESVLASRPYVVSLRVNAARGHLAAGDIPGAYRHYALALHVNPHSPALQALHVTLLHREGQIGPAMRRARALLVSGVIDQNLVQEAYVLGRSHDLDLAILAMHAGIRAWPQRAMDGWLRLGHLYLAKHDPDRARKAFATALALSPPMTRWLLQEHIPKAYRPVE